MSVGKKFSSNLKEYRETIGISQRELGRRINKTGQYISYLEKEENPNPTLDVVEDIAEILNVSIYDLLKGNAPEQFIATVSVKDTGAFKELLGFIKDVLVDERIGKSIRQEYYEKYLNEVEKR